jgi:hypothetical protein
VVDTKNTAVGAVFNRETLDIIPTARDPWMVINMVPGVIMSGVNVGGSASGQQLTATVRGGASSQNMWNIEGASTTDMAATGASAVYYDFDSFSEIQVTTGGSDASVQTGGLNINMISKSGSNVFKGTFSAGYEDDNMQWKNVSREQFYGGGTTTAPLTGTPMIKNYEYGGDVGGPIIRNRLWYLFAARKNMINNTVVGFFQDKPGCNPPPNTYEQVKETIRCMHPDWTELNNMSGKVNYQLNSANRFQFLLNLADKVRNARDAGVTRPPETVYHQYSGRELGTPTYNLKHTWVLSDKLVFDNAFNHTGGGFVLDFPDVDNQWDLQPLFDDDTNIWHRSFQRSVQGPRPNTEIKTDSSYFLSNLLGGDHQLKFGVRYKYWETGGGGHVGGNAVAQYDDLDNNDATPVTPELVQIYRDGNTLSKTWTYGGYLQDNFSRGKLRLNMGLRYDFQDGKTKGTCAPASTFAPDILPAFCWNGADETRPWKDLGPRISATYDLFGTGKTVLKGSYALYFEQAGLINTLGGNPASGIELNAPWNDLNGDQFVQYNEVDWANLTVEDGNFDLSTGLPAQVVSQNQVDANIRNDRTKEAIGTISHELFANFGVDVSYIWRRDDRGTWSHRIGETRDMWVQREWPTPTTPPAAITAIPAGLPTSGWQFWEIAPGVVRVPNRSVTHQSPAYADYFGWEIAARKRMSNRWQMNASFTWNDRRSYDNPAYDRGNFIYTQGYNAQNRFNIKFSGAVQLPGGFTLAQNTIIQEGDARAISFNAQVCRSGGLNSTTGAPLACLDGGTATTSTFAFRTEPAGTTHLPTTSLTDLALSKQFRLARGRAVTFEATVFNLFNVNTIRGYSSSNLSNSTFTRVSSIVPPRVLRVFARVNF